MAFFDAAQKALANGLSVFYGELYDVGFTSGIARYWDGFGSLVAYTSTYLGAAQVVQRSDIPIGVNDEQGSLSLTFSGVDPALVTKVRASTAEFYGRPITIWGQFFDDKLQLSGNRFQLFRGTMDVPTYGSTGPHSRQIVISCEGEWSDRNGAELVYFSDAAQKKLFAGDRGLEYVYRYSPGVKRRWPIFGEQMQE